MMPNRVVLINYANEPYKKAQHFNSWTGRHIAGIKEVIEYGPEDIDTSFYKSNQYILDQKRGAGEWLWKPYFILKTLEQINFGEYVFYCDSGSFFCRSFKFILESMGDEDIWLCNMPLVEKQWTKPVVFDTLDANTPDITETNQIQGGFICIKKSDKSVDFIREWLESCCKQELIMPLREDEEKGACIEHREDQSLISVLSKKHGLVPHKDPSQYGRVPEKYYSKGRLFKRPINKDSYPVCIILHRTKDVSIKIAFRQWLCAWMPLPFVYQLSNVKRID